MAAVRDVILMVVVLFIFGMGFFVINFATKTMVTAIVNVPLVNNSVEPKQAFNDLATTMDRLDYLVFGVFIAYLLGIIISGWYVAGNPLFVFIYFLVTTIGVIVSIFLSNVWYEFSNNALLVSSLSSFPITNHLLTFLPMYATAIGILGLVVMFAKPYVDRSL